MVRMGVAVTYVLFLISCPLSLPCMLAHRLPLKKSVLGSIFLVQTFPPIRQTLVHLGFSFTLNSGVC